MTETTAPTPNESAFQGTSDRPTTPLFVRPRDGRMVAGVCAGIAARWRLDVTLVRIAMVVLTLLSGVGLAAYVTAWLLTPSTDGPAPLAADSEFAGKVSRRGRAFVRKTPKVLLIGFLAVVAVALLSVVDTWWLGLPFGLVVAVAVLGALVSSRVGRWAVSALALVVAVLVAVIGVFGASIGSRALHVATVDDLRSSYEYGIGSLRLDLAGMPVTGRHHTDVRVGRGNVTVIVPTDTATVVHARAGLGSVTIDGHRVDGVDAEQSLQVGAGTASDADRLTIDIEVGVGEVTVREA